MTSTNAAILYVGVNMLLLLYLAVRVVLRRGSAKISIGTGGDADLELRSRVHGNATEYIPITMLGLYLLATLGMPVLWIHIFGGGFTLGRFLHAFGLARTVMAARQIGMVLTWLGMLMIAGALIVHTLI